MGERRKRKPVWDSEDGIKNLTGMREHNSWTGKDCHSNHGSGCYQEFSDTRSTFSRKSRDHSGWRSWESIEHPPSSSFKNSPEGREMGGSKGYHKNLSPEFHGTELLTYDHIHEYDRSHPQRYMGRGRSRSRSKSRNRGRSRSRSFSRGRERVMVRGWSRSRSRSRNDGNTNDQRRSRSPIRDYRNQSYGLSDKRSGPDRSSLTCRDFTSGRCRRGSECRFFHPNSLSHRDSDFVGDDAAESWKSRADYSRTPKHSYSRSGYESQNDEQFPSGSKSSAPCKDFVRGKCRWGDTCRFSHATLADSFGHGRRNMSFDKDFNNQHRKSGMLTCKYFAAGKCDRYNCRFSHEVSNRTNLEGRLSEVTDSRSSHDKGTWRNASKWDDTMISDTHKPTNRGENIVTDTNSTGVTGSRQNDGSWRTWGSTRDTSNRQTDARKPWGSTDDTCNRQTDDARKPWGVTDDTGIRQTDDAWKPWGSTDDTGNKETDDTWKPWGSTDDTGYRQTDDARKPWGCTDDTGNRQTDDAQKPWGSTDDTGNRQNDDARKPWGSTDDTGNRQHDARKPWGSTDDNGNRQTDDAWKPWGNTDNSGNRQTDDARKPWGCTDDIGNRQTDNAWKPWGSTGDTGNSQTDDAQKPCSSTGDTDNKHNDVGWGPRGYSFKIEDKNWGIEEPMSNSLNSEKQPSLPGESRSYGGHTHSQNYQKTVQSPVGIPQLITNLLTIKHSDQLTRSPVSTAGQHVSPVANPTKVSQSFENEQSQACSGADLSNSRGALPCLPSTTRFLPLVNTVSVQPNPGSVSVDLLTPMVNNREITKDGNNNLAHGTEQINRMQLKRSSPSSVLGTEFDGSKAKTPEGPKQQEKIVANSVVTRSANATGEESKGFRENKPSETLDGHVKPEDESANKDEKGMRVFKNALIEFVKEILKPSWKEGRMSREVHKTIVKKVIDQVSCTIQVEQVPKTRDKIEQYLSFSKPKITKLVQAYVERCQKTDG